MKKHLKVILITAMLSMSLVGCGEKTSENSVKVVSTQTSAETQDNTAESTANKTEAETSAQTEIAPEHDEFFTSGVWHVSTNDIPVGYYIMDEGVNSGRTIDFESGKGVSFSYTIGINEAVFSFGSSDNEMLYKIVKGDPSFVVFELPDGSQFKMSHDPELSPENLDFYSNTELCDMALNYFTAHNDYTPSNAAALTNSDGTVTIQLYDNLGDHNSNTTWYTVDRFTASGTDDSTGEEIQLS